MYISASLISRGHREASFAKNCPRYESIWSSNTPTSFDAYMLRRRELPWREPDRLIGESAIFCSLSATRPLPHCFHVVRTRIQGSSWPTELTDPLRFSDKMPAIARQLLLTTNLGPTLGATYVGAMVTGMYWLFTLSSFIYSAVPSRLYGSTTVQTFLYLKNYPLDWTFQKCAVSAEVQLKLSTPYSSLSLLFIVSRLFFFGMCSHTARNRVVTWRKRQDFGLVAHSHYHRRILALSHRFLWKLCRHPLHNMVRRPSLDPFAGAHRHALREFKVSCHEIFNKIIMLIFVTLVAIIDWRMSLYNHKNDLRSIRLGRRRSCCTKVRLCYLLPLFDAWCLAYLVSTHYEYGDVGGW